MMLLPLGFRFAPTDAEAICLLSQRLLGQQETTTPAVIADVNIYEHEPWDLLSEYLITC